MSSRIKQLKSLGFDINSIKGKGYRLCQPVSLLDADAIRLGIDSHGLLGQVSTINVTAQTESTNNDAKQAIYNDSRWQLHCTEYQWSGRGRRGRQWQSTVASNVMMTLARKSHYPASLLYNVSLVVGVAIARVLKRLGVEPTLKWPNDVYVAGKKICGILCEIQGNPLDDAILIIGVGVNVNSVPDLADVPVSCLRDFGIDETRSELITLIAVGVIDLIGEVERSGSDSILSEWAGLDMLFGRQISVLKGSDTLYGVAKGIDSKGELIVELDSEEWITLNGGEVSIRW